jgi:Flp pilus assembly pilin Flp
MTQTRSTSRLLSRLRRLRTGDDGQDLVEYGVVAMLIAIIAVVALTTFGGRVAAGWQNIVAGI